mgnify:CR=1 FL=1
MGIRKKVRTLWKAQRKLDITRRRKQKAIRIVKGKQAPPEKKINLATKDASLNDVSFISDGYSFESLGQQYSLKVCRPKAESLNDMLQLYQEKARVHIEQENWQD